MLCCLGVLRATLWPAQLAGGRPAIAARQGRHRESRLHAARGHNRGIPSAVWWNNPGLQTNARAFAPDAAAMCNKMRLVCATVSTAG